MQISHGISAEKPYPKQGWVRIGGDSLAENGTDEVRKMRNHQKETYDTLKDERRVIIQHPGGSGKSTTVRFIFGKKIKSNNKQKLIIVVPQQLISKSFLPKPSKNGNSSTFYLEYPDEERIAWDLTNLCEKISNGKTKELTSWLTEETKSKDIRDRIVVTTYHALVLAWKKMTDEQKKQSIKNTAFVMDEAHRIMYQEITDDSEGSEDTNCIGEIIRFIVNKDYKDTFLWLTTATFIRGDKNTILPPDIYSKFKKDYLPLDKYWEEIIENILSFSYDFVIYKGINPDNEIKTLLEKNKYKKTLIYCPRQGTKHGCKYEFRDRVIKIIHKTWKNAEILDLVEEDGRDKRKEEFLSGKLNPDIILAVDLFNEGVDWVECEQIFDIVPSNSLRVQIQRIYRLWRDHPGKNHISYYTFFQFSKKVLNEDNYLYELRKIVALWTAAMIIDEELRPINIQRMNGDKDKKNHQNNGVVRTNNYANPFKRMFPDLNLQNEILEEVAEGLIRYRGICEELPSIKETEDCIRNIVEYRVEEMEDVNFDENVIDEIVNCVAAMLRRKVEPNYGVDVSFVVNAGFKTVWKNEIYDKLLMFGTDSLGIRSYAEFRNLWGDNKTVDEWVKIAEQLAEENGWDGKLTGGIKGFTEEEIAEMRAEYEAQES